MVDIRPADTVKVNNIPDEELERIILLNKHLDNKLSDRAIAELKNKKSEFSVNRLYITPKAKVECGILIGNEFRYYIQTRNLKVIKRKSRHPLTGIFVHLN